MQNLLKKLAKLNISIDIANDQLDIKAPKGSITPELLQEIKLNKESLISFVSLHKKGLPDIVERISKAPLQDSYVLSSAQKQLWLLDQIEKGNKAYNMPNVFKLIGNINVYALNKAYTALIERHEVLRTQLVLDKFTNEPRQVIGNVDESKFQLGYYDLVDKNTELEDLLNKELTYSFDLSSDALVRSLLLKTSENNYVFSFVIHHIISDGWSSRIILQDLFSLYSFIVRGEDAKLPILDIQYKDYANWQQAQLSSVAMNIHQKYWLDIFKEGVTTLDLSPNNLRPSVKSYKGKTVKKTYATELFNQFKSLCNSHDATLFMGIAAVVNTLLHKYSNQTDIVIGTPVAGRKHPDLQNQIGLYVNTLALKTCINIDKTFNNLLLNIKQSTLQAYEHEEYPFDELILSLKLPADRSRNPLFDVLLTVDTKGLSNALAEITIEELPLSDNTSKFDLEFAFVEKDKELSLLLTYNPEIYNEDFAIQLSLHFETLLQNILTTPETSLRYVSCLSADEKERILKGFNNTTTDYPESQTIDGLIEEQTVKTPDNIAVVFKEQTLTYKELNDKSNQLAHYLRAQYQIKAGDLIGLKLERNEQLLVVALGILKSGAAYVPIDVSYPKERIDYIQEDSNCKLVIDTDELSRFENIIYNYSKENLQCNKSSANLAYIIYTSGTTGKPKGVMITHKNAVAFICWAQQEFSKDAFEVTYAATSHCFDLSVYEMFFTLSIGKKVKVLSHALEIGEHLKNDRKILLNTVPSSIRNIIDQGYSLDNVSYINLAGEAFPADIVPKLLSYLAEVRNLYGPSEDTTYSTFYKLSTDKKYDTVPIGRPISNTQAYILDDNLKVQPIGVPGKLYLSGAGLAPGYLNQPALTTKKFIENPFLLGERMYDTGDIAKWMPDGNIAFLGRKDHQVKLRGFRIELGEIENTILTFSAEIHQTVVEVKVVGGESVLAAYFTENTKLDREMLRNFLQLRLPAYMVPGYFIKLDTIPLSSNGKIDRKALPEITEEAAIRKVYAAPRNEVEVLLVDIWQEVLGIEKIGITDNFFELGGHSLIVTQVINRTYKELGKSISFRDFFANPTIERLSKKLKESHYSHIPKATEAISYPLTSTQNRLWILSQSEGGSVAYNMPVSLRIKGDINYHLFQKSFDNLIQRHEILRTYFKINEQGEIRQHVVPFEAINFVIDQVDFINKSNTEKEFEDYLQSLNDNFFDLTQAPLLRVSLIKITNEEHIFFFSRHHIIGDGWSSQIIISEVVKTYNVLVQGKEINLPELNIQYKDYAVWFNKELQHEKHQALEQYWLQKFSGELPVLDLPSFKIRSLVQTYNGDSLTHTFSKVFLDKIKTFSKEHDVTLFMSLVAGINSLLYRYTGQDDIIIGTPIAGREHPDLENQLGLYLNTLAIRTQFKEKSSFLDLVAIQKETLLGAYEHQSYPFDRLVGKLNLKRDTSRSVLFDVMVVLQNQGQLNNINNEGELKGLQVEEYDFRRKTTQFDLNFIFVETEGLALSIEYNTDIYDAYLVERMFVHFENLMSHAINNSKDSILSIDYIPEKEKKELLEEFNNTTIDYPKEKTIVDLFEEQVIKTPDNIAVVFEEQKLTYTELNKEANQLAQYLRKEYAIQPDDLIGIKLDRSEQLLVAIFGILKSGAAYVPIDINYPEGRVNYILEDTNCKTIIDQKEIENFFTVKDQYSIQNLQKITSPNHLAYVIYTSGTTGNPKGVMVTHRNVVSLIKPCYYYQFNKDTILLSTGSVTFDAVIFEYYGSLLNGSKLVLTNKEVLLDMEKLYNLIQTKEINSMWMTASWFEQVVDTRIDIFNKLRYLIVGGDVVSSPHVLRVYDVAPEIMIVNGYGPTENTTFSTTYPIENRPYKNIPIGTPLPNSQAFILNDSNVIVSIGVTGELCLSGDGLSLGYLNKPELTNEKFIDHPFKEGEKLYKTGDLARWLPDGNIEFLGRKDFQVKIRGHRIELGEIEHSILSFEGVHQVVVLGTAKNDETTLIAYLIGKATIDKVKLISFLKAQLPDYMVPSYFIQLEEFPLTSSGKINRKVLPEPTEKDIIKKEYVSPTTEIERQLVGIWEQALNIEKIGITDNFFELGGHSLHTLQVINKVNLELNYTLSFKDIFKTSTIKELAQIINNEESELNVSYHIPKSNNTNSTYELSPSQKRLWITAQLGGSRSFNIPFVFDIFGGFNSNDFESAIVALLSRHNALRTSFKKTSENEVKQYVASIDEFNFHLYVDEVSKTKEEIREYLKYQIQGAFDLENGPLLRAGVYKVNDQHHVAYLVLHHLITDGWSMEVIFQEIYGHYMSIVTKNKPMTLKPLDIQYTDYADWLQKNLTNITEKERPFWHKKFEKELPLLQLPFERKNRPLRKTYEGSYFNVILQKNETKILKDFSTKFGVTTYASLLSIFKILLYKYSNISELCIGLPVSGRFNNQVEHQIGLYVNTLPIRTKFDKCQTFKEIITNEGKSLIDYYDNSFFQMDDLLKELNIKTHNGRTPLFDIMLIHQNQATTDIFTENNFLNNVKIESWKNPDIHQTQYDITIAFWDVKGEMDFQVYYNSDVYEQQHLEVVIKDYIYLIKNIIHYYDIPIDTFFETTSYSFLTDAEIIYERTHDDNSITRQEKLDEVLPQDLVSKGKLHDLLKASLGKDLSFNDDYFEVGGSSLSAIELVENINEALHAEYSILDFYENASVDLFHNYIQRKKITQVEEKEDDFVINFTKHTTDENKPNLIIFPPLLGEGILFKGLSNRLEQDLNVYAISIPIIDASENVLQELLTSFKERLKSIIVPGKVNYILGYSIGVNFAYEVATHFEKEGIDIEMFLIDRGPISSSYKPTPKIIRQMIDYNKPLIDSATQMGIDENILHQRIEQSVKAFSSYKLKEKTNVPIYSFESEARMKEWKKYTSKFKGVQILKGTHHEALTKENIETISQTIKNAIRISLHN